MPETEETTETPEVETPPKRERRPWGTSVRVPETGAYPLSPKAKIILRPAIFEAICLLGIVTTLRDRFRCPRCKAVGTFKPHGGVVDEFAARWNGEVVIKREAEAGEIGIRRVRRWLCKFCGLYYGPEGTVQAFIPNDPDRPWWVLPAPFDPESPERAQDTPDDVLYREIGKVWPWNG
jgi:rubredoxin